MGEAGSLLRVAALAGLGVACGRPPVVTPPPPAPAPATECVEAGKLRAEVDGLVALGKLDRTVRVTHEADLLCPASSGASRLPLLRALVELDRTDAASEVAHAILGAAHAPAEDAEARDALREIAARDAGRRSDRSQQLEDARALFSRAQGARGTPEGQRLLDRGVAAAERIAGPMQLDVRRPEYGGAAWLPDGGRYDDRLAGLQVEVSESRIVSVPDTRGGDAAARRAVAAAGAQSAGTSGAEPRRGLRPRRRRARRDGRLPHRHRRERAHARSVDQGCPLEPRQPLAIAVAARLGHARRAPARWLRSPTSS